MKNYVNKNIINQNIKIIKINFILKKVINAHHDTIHLISSFPSGNFISVSNDRTIKIFDNNLNNIQTIIDAHDDNINYIDIKDENNFMTCSYDCIKTFNKNSFQNNIFRFNKIIKNAHYDTIYCIKYYLNTNIISCSRDKTIKLWEEKNEQYQCITIIKLSLCIKSLLILKTKNIFISSGFEGTNLWNMYNFECITNIKEVICYNTNMLKELDDDRIIVGDDIIKVISISNKTIIKEINNEFRCIGLCVIREKKIFLIGGYDNKIRIYRSDIFELIETINNAHDDWIYGFTQLKNDLIATYGRDRIIKIWLI